jgi:hypothetical protein
MNREFGHYPWQLIFDISRTGRKASYRMNREFGKGDCLG